MLVPSSLVVSIYIPTCKSDMRCYDEINSGSSHTLGKPVEFCYRQNQSEMWHRHRVSVHGVGVVSCPVALHKMADYLHTPQSCSTALIM